ncbi:MAG: HAD-IIA family hydrolase [bacterium]|nr:HAD-IIA family hydrolase [bacterium]
MDGTIYLSDTPIPGAPEFIAFLRDTDRRPLFFTNNPTSDANRYAEKLTGMGIAATPDDVLTSGEATARFLATETTYRRVFVLGTRSFEEELQRSGMELVDSDPEAVVLSFDKTLTYAKLEKACHFLRAGAPYIATNPDKVCPTEHGPIPDCGAMAALLKEAADRSPRYIGKPNPEMIRMGMDKIGATADSSAMVGDRTYTDMQMAYNAGIASILVLSGETTPDGVATLERRPDYVFESVRELHDALRDAG